MRSSRTDLTYLAGYIGQNHTGKTSESLAGTSPSEFFRLIPKRRQAGRTVDTAGTSASYLDSRIPEVAEFRWEGRKPQMSQSALEKVIAHLAGV